MEFIINYFENLDLLYFSKKVELKISYQMYNYSVNNSINFQKFHLNQLKINQYDVLILCYSY